NGPWLSERIVAMGWRVKTRVILPDEREAVSGMLNYLRATHDVIVVTGGLGATRDDLTVEIVSELLGLAVEKDEAAQARLVDRLTARYGLEKAGQEAARHPGFKKPAGAIAFDNRAGLASGHFCAAKNVVFCLLPGVPREMK